MILGGPASWSGRRRPAEIRRVLIAHHLFLGDTLMLTPLLAKLRRNYPNASTVMTVPTAMFRLYEGRPFGVEALPYDPSDLRTLRALSRSAGYDLALIPGDNRFSWLAAALGARWIVAFGGDRPAYKSWPVDELRPYRASPGAWGDLVTDLIDGEPPPDYEVAQWPAPSAQPFAKPGRPYAVLHVGASTPLKLWPAERWRALARTLEARGLQVVWSAGKSERPIVDTIDPEGTRMSCAGKLDLAQMWQLLAGARLLVCPDTGVAHMGRLTGTPTIALFGPGSQVLSGAGSFWRSSPYWPVTVSPFACRDQHLLFKRHVDWVQRCHRSPRECLDHRCMQAITFDMLGSVLDQALSFQRA
jgi:ADP-heptose:LPS heptosyltransferase